MRESIVDDCADTLQDTQEPAGSSSGTERGLQTRLFPQFALMDCRSFKKNHLAFLDETMPGTEAAAMRAHMQVCPRCAQQDTAVRRALLLVRNLPPVTASADFSERLKQRMVREARARHSERAFRGPSVSRFVSITGALVVIGTFSLAIAANRSPQASPPRLNPVVVASTEASDKAADGDLVAPAFIASMSTGIPVWPALLLAEQGSLRFAATEVKAVSFQPTPQP